MAQHQYNQGRKLTLCSFFAGGGLCDYGFKDVFDIIWANEINPNAAIAYQANIGRHLYAGDITEVPVHEIPYADVFLGTPPCQDFSSDGVNRGEEGDRGKLVWAYLEIIKAKYPKAFMMENVIGLARKHRHTLDKLKEEFQQIGYIVTEKVVDCADYGVSQHRNRVFLIGIRMDLGFQYKFPEAPMIRRTVRDAIGDLTAPEAASVDAYKIGTVPNHLVTWTSPTPERIHDVVANPRPNQRRGMRRLEWDRRSFTLTHHIGKDGREFLHPTEDRRISVREALRVMSVPDTYVFPPEIRIREQYFIVGNGVPTLMANILAKSLNEQLVNNLEEQAA